MIMASTVTFPTRAFSHHNGSRDLSPQVNDRANRPSFGGRFIGGNTGAQEKPAASRRPRFVRKYPDGDVLASGDSNGNSPDETKVEYVS